MRALAAILPLRSYRVDRVALRGLHGGPGTTAAQLLILDHLEHRSRQALDVLRRDEKAVAMVLDYAAGPVGQSKPTTAMPLLMASRRMSGNPSKRELSTKTEASAMSAPMSAAGPSRLTTTP